MKYPQRNSDGTYHFEDYPNFRPNLAPWEIFELGSFGGTYWRPIYSSVVKKHLKNQHLKYPKTWWKNLSDEELVTPWDDYNKRLNKYGVKVGTTLEFWENKGWIKPEHPYGWIQWYCDFFMNKENRKPSEYNDFQVSRWAGVAGEKGRFRNWLINMLIKKGKSYDDYEVSPAIRQTLQHWGYQLTKEDFHSQKN